MWRGWHRTLFISIVSDSASLVSAVSCDEFSSDILACASDMTGAQDGSVRMFEWNRPQQLICFRQAGNARITRLYFNSQGNKVHTHVLRKGENVGCLLSACWLVLIFLNSCCSAELLTERDSSVSGRSTRRPPTPNLTWWGRLPALISGC